MNPTFPWFRLTPMLDPNAFGPWGASGTVVTLDSNFASVVIGHTTTITSVGVGALQVLGTTEDADSHAILGHWSTTNAEDASLTLLKSGSGTIGSSVAVVDNELLGTIRWTGDDGTNFDTIGARIRVEVDGSPASNRIPSAITWAVASGGGDDDIAEAMRLTSAGILILGAGEGGVVAATGDIFRAPAIVTGGAGNLAGADMTIASGVGTGIGDPGQIIFQLANVAATGDNLQALSTLVTLDGDIAGVAVDITAAGITSGTVLDAGDASALTVGKLYNFVSAVSGSSLANRSAGNDYAVITSSRTDSRTGGTTADDYDVLTISRTSVTTGAGGTLTAAGSVLKLENVATQTAGTLTDTVTVLELVQDTDSTGAVLTTSGGDIHTGDGQGIVFGHNVQQNVNGVSEVQVLGTAQADSSITIGLWSTNNAVDPLLTFLKSGDGTIGTSTTVATGELIGQIRWFADDGTNFGTKAATIACVVNGTVASNRIPTDMIFSLDVGGSDDAITEVFRLGAESRVATFQGAIATIPDEITATSTGVAASLLTTSTEVTTNDDNDLDNVTLANGTSGQIKRIYCTVSFAGDTWKITPATMLGGSIISFGDNSVGNGCELVWADTEGWIVIGNNGGTIS